jgi:prepilin-type N-terminal cleavage/methylation domain-containing protein
MRRLRTDEAGFSLMELVMAMALGSIILTAVMTLFITGVKSSAKVTDRVEAQQRAQVAMDRVTTLLSSQVCLNAATPPIVTGSTASSVTFYGDLKGASTQPDQYRITWDPTARTLTETKWKATGNLPSTITYTEPKSRVIARGVLQGADDSGVVAPVFRYYRFETNGTVNLANPVVIPATGITAADAGNVVQVGVTFLVVSDRTQRDDARATSLTGQALAGSADPASPIAGPNCQ